MLLVVRTGLNTTVRSGAVLYVTGTVQNTAGAILTNAGTVQLTDDLANAGTLASPGTLRFSGAQNQTFAPGAASVSTLTLANSGATGANRLFLTQDLTVGTLLTLTQGLLRTQVPGGPLVALSLPDGAALAGEQSGHYVQGRLAATRGSVSGVVYYRLRQVDADGTARYSLMRPVAVPPLAGLSLFPNPTRAAATLIGAAPGAAVQVLDAGGAATWSRPGPMGPAGPRCCYPAMWPAACTWCASAPAPCA